MGISSTDYNSQNYIGPKLIGVAIGVASGGDYRDSEYSASEIRKLLQVLFPQRQLVLSQFTFFNQIGVANPTGETFRRGRRCYRLTDILSIACVLALKEEGIPLKNIEVVPQLVQQHAKDIFAVGAGSRLSGYGDTVALTVPGFVDNSAEQQLLTEYLENLDQNKLFWGFDLGVLAEQLTAIAQHGELVVGADQQAA